MKNRTHFHKNKNIKMPKYLKILHTEFVFNLCPSLQLKSIEEVKTTVEANLGLSVCMKCWSGK